MDARGVFCAVSEFARLEEEGANDFELPGMWEAADLSGGLTDSEAGGYVSDRVKADAPVMSGPVSAIADVMEDEVRDDECDLADGCRCSQSVIDDRRKQALRIAYKLRDMFTHHITNSEEER